MSIFDFAAGFENGVEQAERAVRLSNAVLSTWAEFREESPLLGVGLMVSPVNEMLQSLSVVIAIDVNREPLIGPTQFRYLYELEMSASIVRRSFLKNLSWLKEVRAFGIFEPELHLSPADRVQASLGGSAGASLSWLGGSGFAMAGHVAPNIGAQVSQNGNTVGTVIWANNPTGHGTSVEADFSVVELQPGTTFSSPYTSYHQGRPYDDIQIAKPSGQPFPSSRIMGMFVSMALPTHNSTLGDTYMTRGQISSAGDSGAPAISRTGDLIGHVIGASPNITTFVQDLDYQLRAASVTLPNLGI